MQQRIRTEKVPGWEERNEAWLVIVPRKLWLLHGTETGNTNQRVMDCTQIVFWRWWSCGEVFFLDQVRTISIDPWTEPQKLGHTVVVEERMRIQKPDVCSHGSFSGRSICFLLSRRVLADVRQRLMLLQSRESHAENTRDTIITYLSSSFLGIIGDRTESLIAVIIPKVC